MILKVLSNLVILYNTENSNNSKAVFVVSGTWEVLFQKNMRSLLSHIIQ